MNGARRAPQGAVARLVALARRSARRKPRVSRAGGRDPHRSGGAAKRQEARGASPTTHQRMRNSRIDRSNHVAARGQVRGGGPPSRGAVTTTHPIPRDHAATCVALLTRLEPCLRAVRRQSRQIPHYPAKHRGLPYLGLPMERCANRLRTSCAGGGSAVVDD